MDTSAIEEFLQTGLGTLTLEKLLTTLLLLAAGVVIIRAATNIIKRVMERAQRLDAQVRRLILKSVRAALYVVLTVILVDNLGIPVTSLVALVSVFALAISLAMQDVLGNVAGGLIILLSRPFVPGDYISTADGDGTVVETGLTHTKLDNVDGQRVLLPNSRLTAGKIVNYTTSGLRRADAEISASYDADPAAVRRACLRAVERTGNVLPSPAPEVALTAYGESAVTYHVRFWVRPEHYWKAYYACLEEIRRCFAEDGVNMSYNHLNVHILDETKENR